MFNSRNIKGTSWLAGVPFLYIYQTFSNSVYPDWKYIGDSFKSESRPDWKDGGLWAPHVTFYKGKYYMYYSLSVWGDVDPGIGVAVSDSPKGPFKDYGKLFTSQEIGVENSIDPMFYLDKGKPYLRKQRLFLQLLKN